MSLKQKIPIQRLDDGELMGFITENNAGWDAQTIFGYSMGTKTDRQQAEVLVREQGLSYLMGVWQYFDEDDQKWHSCVITEAGEDRVTVIRTNAMGYQDADDYKMITIDEPSEINLVKTQ